jgi:hypothetical protein
MIGFASGFYHAAQFVAFPADPKLIIVFIKQRNDSAVFPAGVLDMNLLANLHSFTKALPIVTRKRACSKPIIFILAGDDRGKKQMTSDSI